MTSEDLERFLERLFSYPNLLDIIPSYADAFEDQVACILRFFICLGVLLILFGRSVTGLFALAIGSILAYVLLFAERRRPDRRKEGEGEKEEAFAASSSSSPSCRRPTKANPFMNRMPYDAADLPAACDLDEPGVRRETTRLFDENLYRDVGDVFHTVASDRQYYTMPSTSVVNDSVGFAQWLYGTGGGRRPAA